LQDSNMANFQKSSVYSKQITTAQFWLDQQKLENRTRNIFLTFFLSITVCSLYPVKPTKSGHPVQVLTEMSVTDSEW